MYFFNCFENKGNEELLTISSFIELISLGPRNFIEMIALFVFKQMGYGT